MFRDFPADSRYIQGLQQSVVLTTADGWTGLPAAAAWRWDTGEKVIAIPGDGSSTGFWRE